MTKKQNIATEASKAADKALLKEVAAKLSNKVLFPEKIARAKALLKKQCLGFRVESKERLVIKSVCSLVPSQLASF